MTLAIDLHLRRRDFGLAVTTELPLTGATAVHGPSGCGKTSLLRCLAGLEQSASGRIVCGSELWLDSTRKIRLPAHRRRIGLVFQHAALFPHLSVLGNLRFAWRRRRQAGPTVAAVARRCGIEHLLGRRPTRLSGGERQRVALARALLGAPRLLLLDEPLASLDAASRAELLPYLQSLSADWGIPLIYVSHQLDEIATLADRILLMRQGQVVDEGPIAQVLTRPGSAQSRDPAAQTVWPAEVVTHDAGEALLTLDSRAGRIRLTSLRPPAQAQLRVAIHARDVSLSLLPADDSTILNIFEARIDELDDIGQGQTLVHLHCRDLPLLARITSHSAKRLQLERGQIVYAQVKAISLMAGG